MLLLCLACSARGLRQVAISVKQIVSIPVKAWWTHAELHYYQGRSLSASRKCRQSNAGGGVHAITSTTIKRQKRGPRQLRSAHMRLTTFNPAVTWNLKPRISTIETCTASKLPSVTPEHRPQAQGPPVCTWLRPLRLQVHQVQQVLSVQQVGAACTMAHNTASQQRPGELRV